MPTVLDGKIVATLLTGKLKGRIESLRRENPQLSTPQLAIVQVGSNPASKTYIGHKIKLAAELGILTRHVSLASDASEAEIEAAIENLNSDNTVHGMIVQLPLDQSVKSTDEWTNALIDRIHPRKDADGLCTANLGRIFVGESTAAKWRAPIPATALGVMRMLEHFSIPTRGKTSVVIGKSRLVGAPTAQLLLQAGATVTTVHSQSPDWSELTQRADIVVAAAGVKHLLRPEHISSQAVLIDVGIHRGPSGLTGDIHPEAQSKSAAYSPVPGGVGQMTVACLMENLVELWARQS